MTAIEPNLRALGVFATAWLVSCVAAFHISEILPFANAPSHLRTRSGSALVFADIILLVVVAAYTVIYCFQELRWTSVVVVGGMIFLFSPFVTQDIPEAFKHSRGGLTLMGVLLMLALTMLFFANFD